jgi:hypothetical protein
LGKDQEAGHAVERQEEVTVVAATTEEQRFSAADPRGSAAFLFFGALLAIDLDLHALVAPEGSGKSTATKSKRRIRGRLNWRDAMRAASVV